MYINTNILTVYKDFKGGLVLDCEGTWGELFGVVGELIKLMSERSGIGYNEILDDLKIKGE